MIKEELRQAIMDQYGEVLVFDNQSYDNSIIGVILAEDGEHYRVVYSESKMINELAEEYKEQEPDKEYSECESDAIEWIEYNTKRALPYMPENKPIIIEDDFIRLMQGE